MNRRQFIKGIIAASVVLSIPKILSPKKEPAIITFPYCEYFEEGDTILISNGSDDEYFTITDVNINKREITLTMV